MARDEVADRQGRDLCRAEMTVPTGDSRPQQADSKENLWPWLSGFQETPPGCFHGVPVHALITSVSLKVIQEPHQNQLAYLLKRKIPRVFQLGFCSIRMSVACNEAATSFKMSPRRA